MKHGTQITLLSALILAAVTSSALARGPGLPGFDALDANGDGEITRAEMAAVREARFKAADADGDGRITQDEIAAQMREGAGDRAARMIERRDTNGDGALTEDELVARDDGRATRMFGRIDANDDGAIDREEFAAARQKMSRRMGERRKAE